MHAVVNKLSLGKPIDQLLLDKIEQGLGALLGDSPEFISVQIVSVSEVEAIIVAMYKTLESLNDLSKNIAGPWFAEHVRPYLSGPVERSVGEVVLNIVN